MLKVRRDFDWLPRGEVVVVDTSYIDGNPVWMVRSLLELTGVTKVNESSFRCLSAKRKHQRFSIASNMTFCDLIEEIAKTGDLKVMCINGTWEVRDGA